MIVHDKMKVDYDTLKTCYSLQGYKVEGGIPVDNNWHLLVTPPSFLGNEKILLSWPITIPSSDTSTEVGPEDMEYEMSKYQKEWKDVVLKTRREEFIQDRLVKTLAEAWKCINRGLIDMHRGFPTWGGEEVVQRSVDQMRYWVYSWDKDSLLVRKKKGSDDTRKPPLSLISRRQWNDLAKNPLP